MCPDEKPVKPVEWCTGCDLSWHGWSHPGHAALLIPIFGGKHYATGCLECLGIWLVEKGKTKADIIAELEDMWHDQHPGETA
jgi:hypothetical protein